MGFVSRKWPSSDCVPGDVSIKRTKVRIISAMSVATYFYFHQSNENLRLHSILLGGFFSYNSRYSTITLPKKRGCQHCGFMRFLRTGVSKIVQNRLQCATYMPFFEHFPFLSILISNSPLYTVRLFRPKGGGSLTFFFMNQPFWFLHAILDPPSPRNTPVTIQHGRFCCFF